MPDILMTKRCVMAEVLITKRCVMPDDLITKRSVMTEVFNFAALCHDRGFKNLKVVS